MTARVLIGKRDDQYGVWVSRPGRSVYSTSENDLMLSTTRTNLTPVMSGVITNPSLSRKSGDDPAPGREVTGTSRRSKSGWVHYQKIYKHNLGYTPIAFFSVGSTYAGEHYPQIYINDTDVRLYHRMESLSYDVGAYGDTDFQYEYTCDEYRSSWPYDCIRASWKYISKGPVYFSSAYPSTMDYNCNIHYILYKQPAS